MRKKTPLRKTVKDTVDLVFELTTANPDGYEIKSREFGYAGSLVVKILFQRGILERSRINVSGTHYRYKWVAASAPTNVLYGSITQEISDFYREKNAKVPTKKKSVKEGPVVETVQSTTSVADEARPEFPLVSAECDCIPLDKYSVYALWEELKRRGCFIKDGRLACIAYID